MTSEDKSKVASFAKSHMSKAKSVKEWNSLREQLSTVLAKDETVKDFALRYIDTAPGHSRMVGNAKSLIYTTLHQKQCS